jgi:small subunit ribosomal protein S1
LIEPASFPISDKANYSMVEDKDSRANETAADRPESDGLTVPTRREIKIGSQRDSTVSMPEKPSPDTPSGEPSPPMDLPHESAEASAVISAPVGGERAPLDTEAPLESKATFDREAPLGTEAAVDAEVPVEGPPSFPPPRLPRITKELQDEIDAALGEFSVDELLGQKVEQAADAGQQIELDSRCRGTVVKVHRDSVFFSLGADQEGVASLKQFAQPPEPGMVLEVVPTKFLHEDELYELVVPGASIEVGDWSDLSEGVVVEAVVTGSNKGGLECEVNRIRGFIPASQISDLRVEEFEQYVGQKLLCVVTEANPGRRNLVLSHRAVLEREKQANREKLLAELEVGQVREGTITRIQNFGAFVDLGGIDGLIHVSQLSWDRIKHPSEVVEVGQRVRVRVEKHDPTTGKIGLSYRDLLVNPWDAVESQYPVGSIVKGTVSKLMEFGAFVRLAPGVEGLVHISELAHRRVQRVNTVVSEGDVVDVKVLSVDRNAQKISLSIKAAQAATLAKSEDEQPEEEDAAEAARPSTVRPQKAPLKGGLNRGTGGEAFGLKW